MGDNEPTKQSIQEAWEAAKAREAAAQNQNSATGNLFSTYSENKTMKTENSFLNTAQGYILIGLICVIIFLLSWNIFKSPPKYSYKVLSVQAQFNTPPTGSSVSQPKNADLSSTSVNLKDEELSILGNEGWELVGTFLEEETTHPNYGSSEYVTGLQPNIRPQRVVMIFKKPL